MSDKSPLFVSSMELIAHSIELYRANNPRKFKFVILHLANSIELILKDMVIDKGESIYKANQPQTIGVWKAHEILQQHNVTITEWPIIELLIDDRNTIQHRFGFPDAESVYYYLDAVLRFFRAILKNEYSLEIRDVLSSHVSKDDLIFLGLADSGTENEQGLDPLFEISPESALLHAYNMIEERILRLKFANFDELDQRTIMTTYRDIPNYLRELVNTKKLKPKHEASYRELRQLRNRAAHSAHFVNEGNADWSGGMKIAKELLQKLDKIMADSDQNGEAENDE